MAKTLISGTVYDISGGRVLIGGTGYDIAKSRTLAGGTGYDVPVKSGTPVSALTVGESVYMNVDGVRTEFLVVHQGNPDIIYDDSCNGTWLLMKDIYERRQWNPSGRNNSYKASVLHAYLNGTFFELFDTNIQNSIKQVKIPYVNGTGGSAVASGSNGLPTKIFLLSGYEVGFTTSIDQYFPIDGAKLDYFVSGNESTAPDKRVANLNGSASYWWLRSPYDNDTVRAWNVNSAGRQNFGSGGYSSANGIRPALILGQSACVDAENNIFAP